MKINESDNIFKLIREKIYKYILVHSLREGSKPRDPLPISSINLQVFWNTF